MTAYIAITSVNCKHHCKLHHSPKTRWQLHSVDLTLALTIMQAMPGITSQLQRGGNARPTNACLMSVLSVYPQMLIIRMQNNRYSPDKLCADISCHIRSAYNTSSALSPLEHIPWGKHHLSAQGTANSCQWRCGGSQRVHNITVHLYKLINGVLSTGLWWGSQSSSNQQLQS